MKEREELMKKKIMAILLTATMVLSMTACGGGDNGNSSEKSSEPEKKEYISETEIADLFTTPDNFKGKYVKLSGQVFVDPEKDDDEIALQVWHDPQNAEKNFIVYYKGEVTVKTNDYIEVDGKITGEFKGENAFGGEVTAPMIEADTLEVKSYMEAVVPTISEIIPENAIAEQNGVALKVDKVEFAEKETRVYLTESNSSADKFSMYVYSIKIVQNGQQIEQDFSSSSSYEGGYAELSSDILPNASSSGVLVFPALDSSAGFQIYAEGSSDNWEIEFAPFTIDIVVQ